jgi:hypothetical protein
MVTGLMAARIIMGGCFDLWRINSETDYLEKGEDSQAAGGRVQPMPIDAAPAPSGLSALKLTPSARDT